MTNQIISKPIEDIIGNLTIDIPFVLSTDTSKAVYDLFESIPQLEGVVVIEESKPVGLIMRNYFYQKLAEQFGHSIYMNRSATLLMDTSPLIIDYDTEITKVGIAAMNRPQNKLYDLVLVNKGNTYIGAVSIRLFLIELSRKSDEKLEVLKLQHENLKKANEKEIMLRKTISEHHEQLAVKSAAVKNLLDNAGQGFLSFGDNYMIQDEYSAECINILGIKLEGVTYMDVIKQIFPKEQVNVQMLVMKSYFNSPSKIKDDAYLHLMPRECKIGHKTIHFDYKRVEFLGKKQIMIVLTNITEKVMMERSLEEERRNQRLIIKTLTNTDELKRALEELYDFIENHTYYIIENSQSTKDALNEIFRCVHTFKGDFAQFGLHHSSNVLHRLEDELHSFLNKDINDQILKEWADRIVPLKITEDDKAVINNILGEDFLEKSNKITVTEEKLDGIRIVIKNVCSDEQCLEIFPFIDMLKSRNIKNIMEQYADYIEYISTRLSKVLPSFTVVGDDIWIQKSEYDNLLKSMVHLFRNICDHGIETPDERLAVGKSEAGNIMCSISKCDNDNVIIKIADDGRGIDVLSIKEKAISKGILTKEQLNSMNEQEIINLVFMQGFSTKSEADMLSGRGVGMTAVKEAVDKLNGSIEIDSELGIGTSYNIIIPKI